MFKQIILYVVIVITFFNVTYAGSWYSSDIIKKRHLVIASDYEKSNKYQRAIWEYRKIGLFDKANSLEMKLKKIMTGEILNIKRWGNGASATFLIQYKNGVKGVFKPIVNFGMNKLAHLKSMASYEVDKMLNLNLVPLTILTEKVMLPMYGGMTGYVMYFVNDVKLPTYYFENSANLRFFDYLIANTDRHRKNFLIRSNNEVVAIDHDLTFDESSVNFAEANWHLLPAPYFVNKLKSISATQWKKRLSLYLSKNTVELFLKRVESFMGFYTNRKRRSYPIRLDGALNSEHNVIDLVEYLHNMEGVYRGYYRKFGIYRKRPCQVRVEIAGFNLRNFIVKYSVNRKGKKIVTRSFISKKLLRIEKGKIKTDKQGSRLKFHSDILIEARVPRPRRISKFSFIKCRNLKKVSN